MSSQQVSRIQWHQDPKFTGWSVLPQTFTKLNDKEEAYFIVSADGRQAVFVFGNQISRHFQTAKAFYARYNIEEKDDFEEMLLDDEGGENRLHDGLEPDGLDVYFSKDGRQFAFVTEIEGDSFLCLNNRLIPIRDEVRAVEFSSSRDSFAVYFRPNIKPKLEQEEQQEEQEEQGEQEEEQQYIQLFLNGNRYEIDGAAQVSAFTDDGQHFIVIVDTDPSRDEGKVEMWIDGEVATNFVAPQIWNPCRDISVCGATVHPIVIDNENQSVLCGWFEEGENEKAIPVACKWTIENATPLSVLCFELLI